MSNDNMRKLKAISSGLKEVKHDPLPGQVVVGWKVVDGKATEARICFKSVDGLNDMEDGMRDGKVWMDSDGEFWTPDFWVLSSLK